MRKKKNLKRQNNLASEPKGVPLGISGAYQSATPYYQALCRGTGNQDNFIDQDCPPSGQLSNRRQIWGAACSPKRRRELKDPLFLRTMQLSSSVKKRASIMHGRNTLAEKKCTWRGVLRSGMRLPAESKPLTIATCCFPFALPSSATFWFSQFSWVLALNS